MISSKAVIVSLLVAASLTGSGGAWSEAARREGGGDMARLQMMLQQLNTEKTNLSAENTKLKAELEKTSKELEAAARDRDAGTQKLGRSSQDLANTQGKADALQRGFDTLKSRFEQLVEQFRTTVATMQELEQERNQLASNVADYEVRVEACERNNEALYKADLELIDLYERKGVMTSLMQRESVSGLKRVQIENLMDEYRGLAEDMRLRDPAEAETGEVKIDGVEAPGVTAEGPPSSSDGA
jgi:chromosome segregation ATPase